MPRKRLVRRVRRLEITEGERLWALGKLTQDHPEYVDIEFFGDPERLRAVREAVRGEGANPPQPEP